MEGPRGADETSMRVDETATVPIVGVVLMVATATVFVSVLGVFVFGVTNQVPETPPKAALTIEGAALNDGVAKNDSVTLVHEGGDDLRRGNIEVTVGDDTVFNRSLVGDRDGSGTVSVRLEGLVVEVDNGKWNDLNKPGPGPPGDGDGDSRNVINQWGTDVTSGDRLVIQERNAPKSYDVIQPGETVRVVWSDGRGNRFVLVEATLN
jgi:hypothetical protein